MTPLRYIIAGCRPWNRELFDAELAGLDGEWFFVGEPAELTAEWLAEVEPRYVFFLHWNWIVPESITEAWECVVFHMTDVPYGRGGSPLQNLMVRGHDETVLTALRMVAEVDAGPVYAKAPLALAGSAEEIYRRADRLAAAMIGEIVATRPEPVAQSGTPVTFPRRTPDQSEMPLGASLAEVDRFVRMLDADGYPRAFLRHGRLRLEFSGAERDEGAVTATVTFTVEEDT